MYTVRCYFILLFFRFLIIVIFLIIILFILSLFIIKILIILNFPSINNIFLLFHFHFFSFFIIRRRLVFFHSDLVIGVADAIWSWEGSVFIYFEDLFLFFLGDVWWLVFDLLQLFFKAFKLLFSFIRITTFIRIQLNIHFLVTFIQHSREFTE